MFCFPIALYSVLTVALLTLWSSERSLYQGNSAAKTNANSGPVTTELIQDIQLQRMTVTDTTATTATTGESFPAGDLWKDQPVIVFVVRRPGCTLCREHGELRPLISLLSNSKDTLAVFRRLPTLQKIRLNARVLCSIVLGERRLGTSRPDSDV